MTQEHNRTIKPVNIRRKIYEFLLDEQERWHRLPTLAEVHVRFQGLTDDVHLHLEQLEREGLLVLDEGDSDRPVLSPTYTPVPEIGVIGKTASRGTPPERADGFGCSIRLDLGGLGIPAQEHLSLIEVPDDLMIDAGIQRGDLAVVAQFKPANGDIVAVEVMGAFALRRYLTVSDVPHLLAENPINPDLRPGWNIPLHGVLWALIRTSPARCLTKQQTASQQFLYRSSGDINGPIELPNASNFPTNHCNTPLSKRSDGSRSRKNAVPRTKSRGRLRPESSSGFGLNEAVAQHHRLVENAATYATWDAVQPTRDFVATGAEMTTDPKPQSLASHDRSFDPFSAEHPLARLIDTGAQSLTTTELLSILLAQDAAAANQPPVAHSARVLLAQTQSLLSLTRISLPEITNAIGINVEQAARVVAAGELGRRAASETVSRVVVDSPQLVCQLVAHQFRGQKHESLRALLLDTKYQLLRIEEISLGSLNESIAHPREIFRPALIHSAYALILTHNHPSGDPTPSKQDFLLTKRLVSASKAVGIEFADHIIIGAIHANRPSYYSFSAEGKI